MRLNGSVALHEVKLQIHLLNQFATAAKTTVCICKIYDPDLQFFLQVVDPDHSATAGCAPDPLLNDCNLSLVPLPTEWLCPCLLNSCAPAS